MQTTRNRPSGARQVRIVVRGQLSSRILRAFDGMAAQSRRGRTELIGEVADQAQLYGLLNRVRDLGLELLELTLQPAERASRLEGESPCHP